MNLLIIYQQIIFIIILSKLIKNSENLKSLILRIHPNHFNNNIFFLSLIEDINKLKNFNLIENYEEPKYYNYKELINKFPKLKERIYYFNDFKIGNSNNYIFIIYKIQNH
jgi:hypothetical protein